MIGWRLTVTAQDLDEKVIRDSGRQTPEEPSDRVHYQVHEFITEQPVRQADVYFYRAIFKDRSHKYALEILHKLVPALKPGAKVVIPSPDEVPNTQKAGLRMRVVSMNVFSDSSDREMQVWTRLSEEADAGLP